MPLSLECVVESRGGVLGQNMCSQKWTHVGAVEGTQYVKGSEVHTTLLVTHTHCTHPWRHAVKHLHQVSGKEVNGWMYIMESFHLTNLFCNGLWWTCKCRSCFKKGKFNYAIPPTHPKTTKKEIEQTHNSKKGNYIPVYFIQMFTLFSGLCVFKSVGHASNSTV